LVNAATELPRSFLRSTPSTAVVFPAVPVVVLLAEAPSVESEQSLDEPSAIGLEDIVAAAVVVVCAGAVS